MENLFGPPKPPNFGKKVDFFPLSKKNWNFFQISINLFYLSFNLKKRKKKLENLFFRDPQIFGTKVDFFPIGKIGIRNVPNFNNFISSKLHIKKKIIKIGEPFWSTKIPKFWDKSGFFSNWKKRNPECSKFQ